VAELCGKRILIIGGTGSLGRALIRRLARTNQISIMSRDEAKHWTIRNRLPQGVDVDFFVGDIRDLERVTRILLEARPQVIIMAAALKQVETCENSPQESIQTNINGISNVVSSVLSLEDRLEEIETVLMVSTDKACSPTNVYGMSKAISERVVTSAGRGHTRIKFVGVRYGNVLESRGSIIPLFKFQVQSHKYMTVTHQDMTRFIMTLDESIDLIQDAILSANSGEIILPKLKSMKIVDLAEIFSKRFSKPVKITGIRPGEKLHEELVSNSESLRIQERGKYYCMNPIFQPVSENLIPFNYSSADHLIGRQQLESYLEQLGIFEAPLYNFEGREIEEISEDVSL
jgi:UDP-glucose 4-epimerase